MNNDVYAFALKTVLDEIQNACPGLLNAFIFKDGKSIARSETTDETTVKPTINAFDAMTERAGTLGGFEAVTIQGADGQIKIASINDFYLATVLSKKADEKYAKTLTQVLVPIVIKLVEKVHSTSAGNETRIVEPEPAEDEVPEKDADNAKEQETERGQEDLATETTEEQETPEIDDETLLPEPPVLQLIIENLSGFLIPSDTLRIDKTVISGWSELYGDKKIEEVDVETLDGKTIRCKFKPIKDSKHEGKGIVRMPEKMQLELEVTKGELVMVKPVVEDQER